jgi:hypothetical protein
MIKKFPEPYKTGVCLLNPNMIIPYIITPDCHPDSRDEGTAFHSAKTRLYGKGVCYWAKDGGVAKFGNVCSDFEEGNNCRVSKTKEDSD